MKKNFLNYIETNYSKFSTGYKKIVDFIKFNQNKLAFLNIKALAVETNTSPATITRFVQEAGFKGYADFQQLFQIDVANKTAPMKDLKTSIMESDNEHSLINVINMNIELLKEMDIEVLEKKLDEALNLFKHSRKVYILGARGSYSLAHYLYFMLKEFRDGIELMISGGSDFTDKLLYSHKDDLLVTISFHPYTNFTCQVTEFFRDNGNNIITITDKYDSILANLSTLVIPTSNGGKAHTLIPAIAILNALLLKLGSENKEETLDKLEKLEVITKKFNIYSKN